MARTEGLDQYLAQQGIDSTQMSEFLKCFNEGAAKIDKKDVAYMAGLQVGQMVSKQWAVSYTHLDVYKRQALPSTTNRKNW